MTTFIITSVLSASKVPLNYTPIRSVFSLEQRIDQSIETINSIRKKFNKVKIIFADCSYKKLSEDNTTKIKDNLLPDDIWCDLFENRNIHQIVHSTNKSAGEANIIKYCLDNFEIPDDVYKISGRYTINDDFDIDKIDKNLDYNFAVREEIYGTTCITSLYRIKNSALYKKMVYELCEIYSNDVPISIEQLIFFYLQNINFNNCQFLRRIGITGKIAVNGKERES